MAYSLSFSEEFFLAEGEPYDRSDRAVNSEGKPVSLYSAICMMPDEQWKEIAADLFNLKGEPGLLAPEAVFEMARETGTCSNLNSPVEVWIDSDGEYRVKVYE